MPTGLVRVQHSGNFHFVTFSCYRRQHLLESRKGYSISEQELESVRQDHGFVVAGYVVMPEHVHLLVSELCTGQLSAVLRVLKQQVSRKLKRPEDIRFWQRRYYDFNVWSQDKTIEKLKYMHRNPVRRGLVANPQDWPWSSFRHYLTGGIGTVEIESEWTSWRRDHPESSAPPTLPKSREG
jgi:putative transposase